jgi:hypothetical protein
MYITSIPMVKKKKQNGKEELLDSLGSDATGITFCVHLSKGTLKGLQSILPRDDGTFLAIQLPLSSKELPL